ncbi:MAG: M13 family peptidase, partial [Bacteroidaceae bacterium]|nr:M13 family peptidase [Bacteroidaceae bacterium]
MKLKTYLSTVAMAVTMASCVDGQGIGIKLENMNDSVAPGTDFYQYACGGWIKNNPLKPEYSRFGSFDAVAETNREQMKELILSLANEKHEKGSVAQKIGDLYTMLMDSTRQNADGIKPIEADMKKIADVQTREEALRIMVENGLKGG